MAIFTESFNQADSTTLGPNLTWTETAGNLETVSNEVGSVSGFSEARAEHDMASADHAVEIDIATYVNNTTAGTQGLRVLARFSASARTHYGFSLENNHASAGFIRRLYKRVAGTFTSLVTDAVQTTSGTLRIEVEGSAIRGLVNGVVVLSTTDTDIAGHLRMGVAVQRHTNGNVRGDNWAASDLGGAVPTPTFLTLGVGS